MSPRKESPFTVEYALLGLLKRQPMHGYTLFKEMNRLEGVGLLWRLKQSKLYALLEKMEADGYLEPVVIANQERPARTEYHLTVKGQQAYEAWVRSPVEHGREMRQEFLARLYFANLEGGSVASELVERQKTVSQGWQKTLVEGMDKIEPEKKFERLVFSFRIMQIQAYIDWLKTCV